MTWSVILLLLAISCVNGSIYSNDCWVLAKLFNITTPNTVSITTTSATPFTTPFIPTATERNRPPPTDGSNTTSTITPTVHNDSTPIIPPPRLRPRTWYTSTINITPTPEPFTPPSSTVKIDDLATTAPRVEFDSNSIYEINSFTKLFLLLRSYHENELRKVQNSYKQLEEYYENEFEEVQRKYWKLEQKVRKLKSSECTTCVLREPDDNSRNNLDNSKELLEKIDRIDEKLSNITNMINITNINRQIGASNCTKSTIESEPGDYPIDPIPTPQPNQPRAPGKYLGCYQDRQDRRMLNGFIKHSKLNSVGLCIDVCRTGKYVFAGIEGQWCRCDNTMPYPKIDFKLNESKCNIKCSENVTQVCGGTGYTLSLYETGVQDNSIE